MPAIADPDIATNGDERNCEAVGLRIEAFVESKREPGRLRMFNLSVLVTDSFMDAIREDRPWQLKFDGTVYKTVAARDLWDREVPERPTAGGHIYPVWRKLLVEIAPLLFRK